MKKAHAIVENGEFFVLSKKVEEKVGKTSLPSLKYIEGLLKSMGNAAFQTLPSRRDCGADAHLDK